MGANYSEIQELLQQKADHFLDRDDPSADVPGDRADAVGNFSSVPVKTFRRGAADVCAAGIRTSFLCH